MKTQKKFMIISTLFISLGIIIPHTASMSTLWQTGDVFFGIGSGGYDVYSGSGAYKETVTDGSFPVTMGCAFNPTGTRFYGTNPFFSKIDIYDVNGNHTSPFTTINTPSNIYKRCAKW